MYYDSVQPTCAAWPKAVSQLFGFFLPLMNRQFGVSQDSGGFKTAAVRGIAYIGLEKSCVLEMSPICQDLLTMNGARSEQCLKDSFAQIYVNC